MPRTTRTTAPFATSTSASAMPATTAKKASKTAKKSSTGAARKPAAKATTPKASKATTPAKRTAEKASGNSALYLDKESYKAHIDGLMAQGLEHADAVDTLKVGLRQANGIPVPLSLTMPG